MASSVRWNAVRLQDKFSRALSMAESGQLQNDYERAAAEVARETGSTIRSSGRGGSHNSEFANIEHKVTRPGEDRYNIRVGWLNPPASAAEKGSGGRLWFQYQDRGFHLFGGPNWIEGVGATIDQRERLLDALEDVNRRWVRKIAGELN